MKCLRCDKVVADDCARHSEVAGGDVCVSCELELEHLTSCYRCEKGDRSFYCLERKDYYCEECIACISPCLDRTCMACHSGDTDDEDDDDVDDVESPNQFPYKKCAECSERKSCGSYNADQEWLCETCAEPEPEGKKVECSEV
mgnify:CR=1 FL=1